MKATTRTLSELGDSVILAPERWLLAAQAEDADGVPLGELVEERRERPPADALVLDTTHARDGLLDVAAAARAATSPTTAKSAKKLALEGDVVVSRLRPYLRQIAFVHPLALEAAARPLAFSSEFYVLTGAGDLAFLLPFLLGTAAQAALAAAQEGGHHPRVPRSSLFGLRVPRAIVRRRRALSLDVRERLGAVYDAASRYHALLG